MRPPRFCHLRLFPVGPALVKALEDLIDYLTQIRPSVASQPNLQNSEYAYTEDPAEIVDTTLLKAYIQVYTSLLQV